MPIDFSQARTPDHLQTFQQSFERGRALGRQRAIEAVLARLQDDPQGAIRALQTLDPVLAGRLERQAAQGQGQALLVQQRLQRLTGQERAAAATHAAFLVQMLRGLRQASADPAQRLAMAQHAARQFPQFGETDESLAAREWTDAGIDRLLAELAPFAAEHAGGAFAGSGPDPAAMNRAAGPWSGQ